MSDKILTMWRGIWKYALMCMICQQLVSSQVSASTKIEEDTLYLCPLDTPFQYACPSTKYAMSDLVCIHEEWVCDGDPDCPEGEDELLCNNTDKGYCKDDFFTCEDDYSLCIPKTWMCDGELDCDDGSDEKQGNCVKMGMNRTGPHLKNLIQCTGNQFQCPGSHKCIPLDKICDNNFDCGDIGDEEGCGNNLCISKSCPSEGRCVETIEGARCSCPEGKVVNGNETACIDLNECEFDTFCDQPSQCHNSEGNYTCSCVKDYQLTERSYCKAINDPVEQEATLLVASGWGDIHQFPIGSSHSQAEHMYNTQHDTRVELLEFVYNKGIVYWISHNGKKGYSELRYSHYKSNTENTFSVMKIHLSTVTDFAYDWMAENWYFVDATLRRVAMCRFDAMYCVVIAGGTFEPNSTKPLIEPRSIALDPNKGFIFFSDWNSTSSVIYRDNMDGSNLIKVVSTKLVKPGGLSIDYANDHLYWTDRDLDILERINYDGNGRTVISIGIRVEYVYAMSIFENYLYVSDRNENKVVKIHRYDYSIGPEVIHGNLSHPGQIHVYHKLKQPEYADNPCQNATLDDTCQICAVSPNDKGVLIKQCLCGAGYTMVDGKCTENAGCSDVQVPNVDEKCSLEVCSDGYSFCRMGMCMPREWWCDGKPDCPDGDDEAYCVKAPVCDITEIQCPISGRCIDNNYRCDGNHDCGDDDPTDELGCNYGCTGDNWFLCGGNESFCILDLFVCDGTLDCQDGSDEHECDPKIDTCHKDSEFMCRDGMCIAKSWTCDGDNDCSDHSDEDADYCHNNTDATRCTAGSKLFPCPDDNKCIPMEWICDGENDCSDGSDEGGCTKHNCTQPDFTCKQNNKELCLPAEKLCDGINDCDSNKDEIGHCNDTTQCDTNPCQGGTCQKSPTGPRCVCPGNMTLGFDQRTCLDTSDPCKQWGVCGQKCERDKMGHKGYHCTCLKGFFLEMDNFSCKPVESEPVYVVYSNRHEIRRVDLMSKNAISLISGLKNTIALDFFYNTTSKKTKLFYTDVVEDKIFSGTIEGNTLVNVETVIDIGLATTEGIAIDWIGKHVYWVESNLDQIEVANLNGSQRTTLIAGNMTSPRAIVVDPRDGALFWTDWDGHNPRIEGCSLSGEGRSIIHTIKPLEGGGWPNGLALDYDFRRVYWIDARSESVHSVDYYGYDYRLILKITREVAHPFALSLFGNYFYWTDWSTNIVVRGNKFNGSNVEVIQSTESQPFDIQIIHPKRQPAGDDPCKFHNGNCSDLCLIGYHGTVGCRCPHRKKLTENGKMCVEDNKFLLFVKNTEIRGVDIEKADFNVIPVITMPHVDNPTAIDYDITTETLYWADKGLKVINRANISGSEVETVLNSGLSNLQGFAIDWLSGNMYFSSFNDDTASISVSQLNGSFRTELITNNITKPTSIALHPSQGFMFFIDIGGSSHTVYQARMDGSEVAPLVTNLMDPKSLSIDTENHMIYFINGSSVMSCEINGGACKVVSMDITPGALTYYNDKLYISDSDGIVSVKTDGKEMKRLRSKTPSIQALLVYDKSRQNSTGIHTTCGTDKGGCSQLCLPTSPTLTKCKCTAGFKLLDDNKSCEGIRQFLLYSKRTEIRGQSFELQSNIEALAPISKIESATALDFYYKDESIFWVDQKANTISRVKRDSTGRQIVVREGISSVKGLAVDWIAGHLYWTDMDHSTVEMVKMDGTNRYVVANGDMGNPGSIVVHPRMGYMYWADNGTTPRIERARLDGSERTQYVYTNISCPWGLTIDYDQDILYWTDATKKTIEAIDLLTHMRIPILSGLALSPHGLTMKDDMLYWIESDGTDSSIRMANKLKKDVEPKQRDDLGDINDIKAYHESRQTGRNICGDNNGGCAELCFFTGDGRTCACSFGKLATDGVSCKDHLEFLLYSKVTSIESIQLLDADNKNNPKKAIKDDDKTRNVIGLAFDYSTRRIFFSDIQRGDIQSVSFGSNISSTDFKQIVNGVGSAEGLAFDSVKKELFWTSYTNSCISKISVNSTVSGVVRKPETVIQLSKMDHPRAIAIDSCQRFMFWTNWNPEKPCIQRANLNGLESRDLIVNDILTPNGLTIDHRARKLYWSDARLDKIERCDMDGTNRIVIVVSIPQHSFGLAVYDDYLFWTDWMQRSVIRVNKYDGTGPLRLEKSLGRQPMGIVAVAEDSDNCELNECHSNSFGCQDKCFTDERGTPYCECSYGNLMPNGKNCSSTNNCNKFGYEAFPCLNNFCLHFEQSCDGIAHCTDGSDEFETVCKNRTCPPTMYSCKNRTMGQCVALSKQCDGIIDCKDGSDEEGCPCQPGQFQCKSGFCIPKEFRCNGNMDCADGSDEDKCDIKTCKDDLFPCNSTLACISRSSVCDGVNDCEDKSDEYLCENSAAIKCDDDQFQCGNGVCITMSWKCDTDRDCDDNSDELNCNYTCNELQFQCLDDNHCISSKWKCDGSKDCTDGSDENKTDCEYEACKPGQMKCTSGRCIDNAWKCDGDPDCTDGKDESTDVGCPPVLCSESQFECANHQCIDQAFFCDHDDDCGDMSDEKPEVCEYDSFCNEDQFTCDDGMCVNKSSRCDGTIECPDSSDERNCTDQGPCGNVTQFQCHNQVCINNALVCNGRDDCGDNSDEPSNCNVNECSSLLFFLKSCSQICNDDKIGYHCDCHAGFHLHSDQQTCIDIDECQTKYPCSHYCENTHGSYICRCADNYVLAADKRTCNLAIQEEEPFLVVSNRHYIHKVTFDGETEILHSGLTHTVAIDFDYQDGMLYWTDITSTDSTINRISINASENTDNAEKPQKEVLHSSTVLNPDGIAVDWVGRNLYWCDRNTDTVEVSLLNGKYRKILVDDKDFLREPRALEVFPAKGYLFISDWGDQPHISRITMDGSQKEKIITEEVAWPNAITIDYVTEKLFWADANFDYIAMADLDGKNRHVIIGDHLPHTFALTTFIDKIFWTDWETNGLLKAQKYSGEHRTRIATMIHRPMDLVVYHSMRQMKMKNNPCENSGCSHLCLLRPKSDGTDGVENVCACPENFSLNTDNKTCTSNCDEKSQFLCASSSKCIPKWWYCDDNTDCEDGSDEPTNCRSYHCPQPGMFQCEKATNASACFPPTKICDGVNDCADSSDEKECASFNCLPHWFKCDKNDTHKCIPAFMRCNKKNDCPGGEDEEECAASSCQDSQHQCNNTGKCIPYLWRCDGDNDCGDWSDEPQNCTELPCKDTYMKCNKTGRCIPKAWKCDGDNDCGLHDNTDEEEAHCSAVTCDPSYFKCNNYHCIPRRWRCDFDKDCRDGSDEQNCTDIFRNCSTDELQCLNKQCIHKDLKCNGKKDCADNSDENDCPTVVSANCTSGEFKCKDDGKCVPSSWKCDSDRDCMDGSDEADCPEICRSDEIYCENSGSSSCLSSLWQCDGEEDCADGSDEGTFCQHRPCPPTRFRCENTGVCIPGHKMCNGQVDCIDDISDELNCTLCKRGQLTCDDGATCLTSSQLCDNATDCKDGADEKSCDSYNPCSLSNKCSHWCTYNHHFARDICSCPDKYKLMKDEHTCILHSPCDDWGKCSQLCTYINQSFPRCSCQKGFTQLLGHDGHIDCDLQGSKPQLVVALEDHLEVRTVTYTAYERNETFLHPSNERKIQGLAIDSSASDQAEWNLFVLSQNDKTISKQNFVETQNNSRTKRDAVEPSKEIVLVSNLSSPRGIAIDWISKHIYWTEMYNKKIEMCLYDGTRRRTVMSESLTPHSIAVDPIEGMIFWTDHGRVPFIGSANLDGTDQKQLYSDGVVWPNGLALDFPNKRVYWADTKSHTIETVSYSGADHHIVKTFDASDPPFLVEVFGDNLFVTTYINNKIIMFPKFFNENTDEVQVLTPNSPHIGSIVMAQEHKLLMPPPTDANKCNSSENVCDKSQICINKPKLKSFSCMCPDKSEYDPDTKQCSFIPCDNLCRNGGTCLQTGIDKKCSCPIGFTGSYCEVDMCLNYCLNEGTCHTDSSNTSAIQCQCKPHYNGSRCEKYECSGLCKNNGLCKFVDDKPTCVCPEIYEGDQCEATVPGFCDTFCLNEGQCSTVDPGYRVCNCTQEYTGLRCELKRCIQQDAAIHRCANGGSCLYRDNNDAMPYCQCQPGYSSVSNCHGRTCDGYCLSNATCTQHDEVLYCKCRAGYEGVRCGLIVNSCSDSQYCLNGGTCMTGNSLVNETKPVYCACPAGYTGSRCEEHYGKCEGFCTRGNCTVVNDVPICTCPPNYKGKYCQDCRCGPYGTCNDLATYPKPCNCTNKMYEGDFCNRTICHDWCFNKGECNNCAINEFNVGQCSSCRCVELTSGDRCQIRQPSPRKQAKSVMIPIAVTVSVALALLICILVFFIIRKHRKGQFRHHRMKDSPNMEVSNPIYMPQATEDEDESQQPLDQPYDFDPEKSTNFANPIYEQYYTHDSTQELLPKAEQTDEIKKSKDKNEPPLK